jgi:hypothetical protein
MRTLTRFWRSLEALGGCATVTEEWKRMTGEEYELARQFLRSSGELATFFPHEDPGICIYRVVTLGPDEHVGLCDETAEQIVLTTEDLIIHELDRRALQRAVAEAFGIRPADPQDGGRKLPWRLGDFAPVAGYRFPVFLAIPSPRTGLLDAVCRLAAEVPGPFVLLAPTGRCLEEESRLLLRRQQACFLPLAEGTCVDDTGRLVASRAGRIAMEEFRSQVVPPMERKPIRAFFATPTGVSWADVRIRLIDGHTVSASVGAVRGVYSFAEMGMANRKNSKPTVQWELLRDFAVGYGVLTWRSAGADRRNKKRRENLARDLQAFFRIEGDPFVRHGDGWQTRFRIEPDR